MCVVCGRGPGGVSDTLVGRVGGTVQMVDSERSACVGSSPSTSTSLHCQRLVQAVCVPVITAAPAEVARKKAYFFWLGLGEKMGGGRCQGERECDRHINLAREGYLRQIYIG